MTKHLIDLQALKAINLAASDEETRYYLKGVCLEPAADGHILMIATDGHLMAAARTQSEGVEPLAASILIPAATIKSIKLARKGPAIGELAVEGMDFTISHAGAVVGGKLIDGTFPDWRCAVPQPQEPLVTAKGETFRPFAHFNPELLARMQKIGHALPNGCKIPVLTVFGAGDPALVNLTTDESAFGVVMPTRTYKEAQLAAVPDWAK